MPEKEKSVSVVTMSYRIIEADEQGSEEKPCKKILLSARSGVGAPMTPEKFKEFLLVVAAEVFPEDQGWDLREVSGEQELTLILGKNAQAPEYSFEERRVWGNASLQFLPGLTMKVVREVLEAAKAWIDEKRPQASNHHRCAFANSVQSMATGCVGGYNGPSAREQAALRQYAESVGKTKFEDALALLNSDDGPIFGPITDLHRQCWKEEFCFDDDPVDVAELTSSTSI